MNKAELVERIASEANLTKAEAERALNGVITSVTHAVKEGKKVAIAGLGTFEKVKRAARTGINPTTKAKINIPAKNAPKFKAAKSFKDLVA